MRRSQQGRQDGRHPRGGKPGQAPATVDTNGTEPAQADFTLEQHGMRIGEAPSPGTRWKFWLACAAVLGAASWFNQFLKSPPFCSNHHIVRGLTQSFLPSFMQARMAGEDFPSIPSVDDIEEIGYASGPRVRACKATLIFEDKRVPFAYTIKAYWENQYGTSAANPALLQTRFDNISFGGNYADTGQPLGSEALSHAFGWGVRRLDGMAGALARRGDTPDIEPLGPCQEVRKGSAYRCRIMFERYPPSLYAFSRNLATAATGQFTFERASDGTWEPSAGFGAEYAAAVAGDGARAGVE